MDERGIGLHYEGLRVDREDLTVEDVLYEYHLGGDEVIMVDACETCVFARVRVRSWRLTTVIATTGADLAKIEQLRVFWCWETEVPVVGRGGRERSFGRSSTVTTGCALPRSPNNQDTATCHLVVSSLCLGKITNRDAWASVVTMMELCDVRLTGKAAFLSASTRGVPNQCHGASGDTSIAPTAPTTICWTRHPHHHSSSDTALSGESGSDTGRLQRFGLGQPRTSRPGDVGGV